MIKQLTVTETILRARDDFFTEIRRGVEINEKITALMVSSFVFLSIYGGVMGASHSFAQALVSMFKLPFLFLVTLAICAPSLHVFFTLYGARKTMAQTIALVLTAIATTSVLLFSLAPINLFFMVTGESYAFFKLMNVAFFAFSGYVGVLFLREGMAIVTETDKENDGHARRRVFAIWVILYGFVGSQMAWVLSPFMGRPENPFMLVHHGGGNFYLDVFFSLLELLGG
jgi:hypothetical protein